MPDPTLHVYVDGVAVQEWAGMQLDIRKLVAEIMRSFDCSCAEINYFAMEPCDDTASRYLSFLQHEGVIVHTRPLDSLNENAEPSVSTLLSSMLLVGYGRGERNFLLIANEEDYVPLRKTLDMLSEIAGAVYSLRTASLNENSAIETDRCVRRRDGGGTR